MATPQKTILVIDDEESIRAILTKKLEIAGFKVETANNGKEGLEKARTIKPDLMILDIMLPIIDGYKICQMLKFDENYQDIPVILLSAKSQEEDKTLGLKTGADLYISKMSSPDFWKELIENIHKLIQK